MHVFSPNTQALHSSLGLKQERASSFKMAKSGDMAQWPGKSLFHDVSRWHAYQLSNPTTGRASLNHGAWTRFSSWWMHRIWTRDDFSSERPRISEEVYASISQRSSNNQGLYDTGKTTIQCESFPEIIDRVFDHDLNYSGNLNTKKPSQLRGLL